MSTNTERNYCNILDILSDKGYDNLVVIMAKHCMSSLLTKRMRTKDGKQKNRTFAVPPKKEIDKIAKMKKEDAKNVLKRHIFPGDHPVSSLKDGYTLFNMVKDNYEVSVKNGKASLSGVNIIGEIPSGTKGAFNGTILMLDAVLPETEKKQRSNNKTSSKTTKKRETKKGGARRSDSKKLFGGNGTIVSYISHPLLTGEIDYNPNLSGLSGIDLRWNILEHYRRKWPLEQWNVFDDYNYYAWAYASLILYLREKITDFYSVYEPYVDPIVGLEHLLQYRLVNTNRYLLSDSMLHDWIRSKYWLVSDPVILNEANLYTLGGGKKEMSGGVVEINIPITQRSEVIINAYRQPYLSSLMEVLENKNISEQDKRLYLIDVYKQIETDDKFRDERSRKLYKKIDTDLWLVTLGNHLDAYLSHISMKLMSTPFAGGKKNNVKGGNGTYYYMPTLYDEFKCAFSSSGPKNLVNLILQPHLNTGHSFSLEFLRNFCTSPYCLYVAGLKYPIQETTLKLPYIKRRNYTDYGISTMGIPTETVKTIFSSAMPEDATPPEKGSSTFTSSAPTSIPIEYTGNHESNLGLIEKLARSISGQ